MEIKDRFSDGLVFQEGGVLKAPKQEDIKYATLCLLCGKQIEIPHPVYVAKVCDECKELWQKIKEKENDFNSY